MGSVSHTAEDAYVGHFDSLNGRERPVLWNERHFYWAPVLGGFRDGVARQDWFVVTRDNRYDENVWDDLLRWVADEPVALPKDGSIAIVGSHRIKCARANAVLGIRHVSRLFLGDLPPGNA